MSFSAFPYLVSRVQNIEINQYSELWRGIFDGGRTGLLFRRHIEGASFGVVSEIDWRFLLESRSQSSRGLEQKKMSYGCHYDRCYQAVPAALESAVSHPESLPALILTRCKVTCEISDDLRHVFDF